MLNLDSDVLSYLSKIKYALNNRDFDNFKSSLSLLNTSEIIYEFRQYDAKSISYAISEIRKKYPVFNEEDILSLYIKSEFNDLDITSPFTKDEIEYLIDFLESNPTIDISTYENLLISNYNSKFKDRIEKLMKRKKINKRTTNNFNPSEKDFLFKFILRTFNIKFDYFYSFDSSKYFTNMFHQNLIFNYLEEHGYSNLVKDIKDALKDNDFNALYKILQNTKLTSSETKDLFDLSELSYDKTLYDIKDVSLLEYGEESLYNYLDTQKNNPNTLTDAIKLIETNFKNELKWGKSFDDLFRDSSNLYPVLLKMRNIYKSIGINIDIDYIAKNIKEGNFNLDFIKELYLLKGLYNLTLYAKLHNINIKKITNFENFLNVIKSELVTKDKNLAFKYNSYQLEKNDIEQILLILCGSSEIKSLPKKEDINIELDGIERRRVETSIASAKEMFESTNEKNREEKYKKYFTDLEHVPGITKEKIEFETYNQMDYLFRQRFKLLLFYDDLSDDDCYIGLLQFVHHRVHKELYENIENLKEEYDDIKKQKEINPNTNYKETVLKVINEYESDIERYNQFIENIRTDLKDNEMYHDEIQDKIDQIGEIINDIRDKEKDILMEFCERKIKDYKFDDPLNKGNKQLEVDLDDFVIIDRVQKPNKEINKEPINLRK